MTGFDITNLFSGEIQRTDRVIVSAYRRHNDPKRADAVDQINGVLTADHSQASYGRPVLVPFDSTDQNVYGPADIEYLFNVGDLPYGEANATGYSSREEYITGLIHDGWSVR